MLSVAPYKIPLVLVNAKDPTPAGQKDPRPEYKLGIYVGLGGDRNPKLYEFDTGGEGFWASYNPKLANDRQWWGETRIVGRNSLSITYSSGNHYTADKVKTSVELYKPNDAGGFTEVVGTDQPVDMGRIVRFSNAKDKSAATAWNNALKSGKPPLENQFYGDFGASLSPNGTNAKNSILSILPQIPIPAGLTIGFIVHVGTPGSADPPYLQVGLTPEDLKSFDTTLPMNPYTGTAQQFFPITGVDTYSERIANADFTWTDAKTQRSQTVKDVGWTIDTGAPAVTVWQGNQVAVDRGFLHRPTRTSGKFTGRFKAGAEIEVSARAANPAGADIDMTIVDGATGSIDDKLEASYHATASMGRNYVNTGLYTFTQYDVMYNLEAGAISFRDAQPSTQG